MKSGNAPFSGIKDEMDKVLSVTALVSIKKIGDHKPVHINGKAKVTEHKTNHDT